MSDKLSTDQILQLPGVARSLDVLSDLLRENERLRAAHQEIMELANNKAISGAGMFLRAREIARRALEMRDRPPLDDHWINVEDKT
jgi:hypothetical protein